MKSLLVRIHQSSQAYPFRKGIAVLLAAITLFLVGNEAGARGFVAVGGGGRGFAVAGRGYGCAGVGVGRYGAVGFRGGLPAGYYGAIPGAYRAVVYGGYNCYYSGGVYYRPVFYQGNTVYVVVS
jgi:hypothetical protein